MGYYLGKDATNPLTWPSQGGSLKIGNTSIPSISPMSGVGSLLKGQLSPSAPVGGYSSSIGGGGGAAPMGGGGAAPAPAGISAGPLGAPGAGEVQMAKPKPELPGECRDNCYTAFADHGDSQKLEECLRGCDKPPEEPDRTCESNCVTDFPAGPERDACLKKCAGGGGGGGGGTENCGRAIVTSGKYPNGKKVEGCPCSAAYFPNPGEPCRVGYTATGVGEDFRCECDKNTPEDDEAGVFDWGAGLKNLMALLEGRAGEYLGMKPGFGDAALTSMFGSGFDKLRGVGDAQRSQLLSDLQTQGLSGTSTGSNLLRSLGWNTESNVGNLMRDVFNANELQKRQDLASYTDIASKLTGQGATFAQLKEAINAARRGESRDYLAMMMQYLTTLMNSWAQ